MMKIALVILTLGDTGAMNLAVSGTETLEDCEATAEVVRQILTEAGAKIEAMRCGETGLTLTPFVHGYGPGDLRWHYQVTLKGSALADGFDLTPVEPGTCKADTAAQHYCAVSAQHPIAQ